MKSFLAILGLIVILCLFTFISCSKTGDTNGPVSPPPVVPNKLVKLITTTFSDGDMNIDSFVYDKNNRVIFFNYQYIGVPPTGISWINAYTFNYTGNDTFPSSYSSLNTNPALTGTPPSYYSFSFNLGFDAQKRLAIDSTVSFSPNSILNFARTRIINYSNNRVVIKTVFPNNIASNRVDSAFYDNNGNVIKHIAGFLDQSNYFTIDMSDTTTFGNLLNTLNLNSIGVINHVLLGFAQSKNLESRSNSTYYNPGNNIYSFVRNYKYVVDSTGLLKKIIVTELNNPASGFTQVVTYY